LAFDQQSKADFTRVERSTASRGFGECCIGWCFFVSGTYSHMTEVGRN
jgi:hypothetical protein